MDDKKSSITWNSRPLAGPVRLGQHLTAWYDVLLMILIDNRERLGEIKAIKAMWMRVRYLYNVLPKTGDRK